MERQRREEWERAKKEELARRRAGEQEEISRLRAKKRSLEQELEAVVSSCWNPKKHFHWEVMKSTLRMKCINILLLLFLFLFFQVLFNKILFWKASCKTQ